LVADVVALITAEAGREVGGEEEGKGEGIVPLLDAVFELSEAQLAVVGLFMVLEEVEVIAALLLSPFDPLMASDLEVKMAFLGSVLPAENVHCAIHVVSSIVLPLPQSEVDL
jgi:hypothetical protein